MSMNSQTVLQSQTVIQSQIVIHRQTRTVGQKIVFCEWHEANGLNISKTSNHFNVSRKQVRNFYRNYQLYLNMQNRRLTRNVSDPRKIRRRGKYAEQEQNVYELFTEYRERGTCLFF